MPALAKAGVESDFPSEDAALAASARLSVAPGNWPSTSLVGRESITQGGFDHRALAQAAHMLI
jgi:hypothetical protein